MAPRVEARINPALLVWARTSAGLDEPVAAKRLKISPDRLVAWEQGLARPTIPQLRKLAELYRRPLAVFYLPEPPRMFEAMHDFRQLAGTERARPSPALHFEIRRARHRREVAVELAELLGEEPKQFLPTAALNDDPVDVASRIRAAVSVPLTQQFEWRDKYLALNNWRSAVEAQGILVFQAAGVAVGEMRGFSEPAPKFPIVVLNAKDSPRGRLFTLFHELAHLALRNGGLCDLHESTRPSTESDKTEVFCNRVAGAILVPPANLREDVSALARRQNDEWADAEIVGLADKYSVSQEVILRSLTLIGAATEAFYQRKRLEYLKAYEAERGATGPVPYFRRALGWNGRRYARLVIEAYDDDRITGSEATEYLGVKMAQVGQIRDALSRSGAVDSE